MERPAAKLADLKLVSKYYPVSNYSYPRPDAPLHRHDVSEGRSSVGSDCSAPGMIEDHESDVSAEEYHTAGSELWDSFWQAKNGEEQRRSQYPALIPSPGPRKTLGDFVEENPRIADQDDHQTRSRTQSRGSDDMPSWPLPPTPVSATLPTPEPSTMSKPAATEQPKPRQLEQHQQQKFITPKASYSLFPTPANNSHRQPLPHRVSQEEIRQSFYQAWHPDLAASSQPSISSRLPYTCPAATHRGEPSLLRSLPAIPCSHRLSIGRSRRIPRQQTAHSQRQIPLVTNSCGRRALWRPSEPAPLPSPPPCHHRPHLYALCQQITPA